MYFKPKSSVTWRAKQVCIFPFKSFLFLLCHSKQVSVSFWKLFQRHLIDNLQKKIFIRVHSQHFWLNISEVSFVSYPPALGFKWLPSVSKTKSPLNCIQCIDHRVYNISIIKYIKIKFSQDLKIRVLSHCRSSAWTMTSLKLMAHFPIGGVWV